MIPVLHVVGRTLPEAWEKSIVTLWGNGYPVKTEYDRPEDPPSRDATMVMVVEEPLCEPRLHRAFPGGLEDLEVYRLEVVEGVHDHWVGSSPTAWTYTYHQRLAAYSIDNVPPHKATPETRLVNQIDYIVEKLSSSGHSRRAQAVTWNVHVDPPSDDPPCLQRVWCRLPRDDAGYALCMNTHWRSRDAFKAAFMNMWALTSLQESVAQAISERVGEPVRVGRYVDISDSYHIYGSYFQEVEGFLATLRTRSFEERTWTSDFAQPFFEEARRRLREQPGGPAG